MEKINKAQQIKLDLKRVLRMNQAIKLDELIQTNHTFYSKHYDSDDLIREHALFDYNIITSHLYHYNAIEGTRVGDFIKLPTRTEFLRVSNEYDDNLQCSFQEGSYYLGCRMIKYSGALLDSFPKSFLELDDDLTEGSIWIFHKDDQKSGAKISLNVPFRTYKISHDNSKAIDYISKAIANDLLPVDHPLHVCDPESPQFKQTLIEYFLLRLAKQNQFMLTKDCVFNN